MKKFGMMMDKSHDCIWNPPGQQSEGVRVNVYMDLVSQSGPECSVIQTMKSVLSDVLAGAAPSAVFRGEI